MKGTFILFNVFFIAANFWGCNNNVEKEYYSTGELKAKAHYQEGVLDGVKKTYYKNGQMQKVMHYKNGELHGRVKEYYKSGELRAEGQFYQGKQNGITEFYYQNGRLQEKIEFDKGMRNGIFKEFYQDGQLKVEGIMKDDTVRKYFKKYGKEGSLKDEFRLISVEPEYDTIILGDSYSFEVSCPGPTGNYAFIEAGILDKNWANSDKKIGRLGKSPTVDSAQNFLGYEYSYEIIDENDTLRIKSADSSKIIEQKQKANQKTFSFDYKPEDTGKHKYMGFYRLVPKDNGVAKHPKNYGFVVKFYVQPRKQES